MARTSKYLVLTLTLICDLDFGAGVMKNLHDTPSRVDAYEVSINYLERLRQEKVYGCTDGLIHPPFNSRIKKESNFEQIDDIYTQNQ